MKKRFSLFVVLFLLGIGQMWGYTVYLYTGDFTDWHTTTTETFKVKTSTDVLGTSLGGYWYRFDVGTYEGSATIHRCSKDGEEWNSFSATISETNNVFRTTGWNAGEAFRFYLVGDGWNGEGEWSTSADGNKMTWNGESLSFTKTFSDVTAGSNFHKLKVTYYNTWDGCKGHGNYDGENSKNVVEEKGDKDGNIEFKAAMQGTVTVIYTVSTQKISIVCQTPVVTFDKEDGTGGTDSQNAEYGVAAANVTAPSKNYHDFAGYFDGDNGTGTQVIGANGAWLKNIDGFTSNDATPKWAVRENKTLHAKWTGKEYEITYKDQGDVAYSGTNSDALPAIYTYGVGIASLTDGIKSGYSFDGWFSTPECDGAPVTAISTTASGVKTLYAKWTENPGGTISLIAGTGGEVSKDNSSWGASKAYSGIKTTDALNIYAKANTGYSFSSWSKTSGSGTITSTSSASTTFIPVADEDATVTASFTENKVEIVPTVHFDAGSAAYTATATVAQIGIETSSVLTASTATTGFTFEGWELSDNLVVVSGDKSKDLSITVRTNGDGKAVSAVANYHEDLSTNYVLRGDSVFGGEPKYWNQDIPLLKKTGRSAESVAYLTVNITEPVGEDDNVRYNFKIKQGENWWGLPAEGENYWFLRNTEEQTMSDAKNIQLRADKAGAYEIKVDFSDPSKPKIDIDFPKQVTSKVTISNPDHGEIIVKNGEDTVKNATEVVEKTELSVEVKSTNPAYYIASLHAYKGGNINDTVKIIDGKLTMPAEALTIVATEEERILQIAGAWDTYQEEEETKWKANTMTPSGDKKKATYEVALEKGEYEFKLINNGAWVTKKNDGAYGLHRKWPGVAGVKDDAANNLKVSVDKAGVHTFTWTYANDSIGIDFPELITSKLTIASIGEHGSITVKNGETPVATNSDVDELTTLKIYPSADAGYEILNWRAYKTSDDKVSVDIAADSTLIMPAYAITITADVELAPKFYITGDSALVVDAGLTEDKKWNAKAIKSTADSYELSLNAAGDYKLKVVTPSIDWKGYDDLSAETKANLGITPDNDGNICFSLTEPSTVTITYTNEAFTITGAKIKPAEMKTLKIVKTRWEVTDVAAKYAVWMCDDKIRDSFTDFGVEGTNDTITVSYHSKASYCIIVRFPGTLDSPSWGEDDANVWNKTGIVNLEGDVYTAVSLGDEHSMTGTWEEYLPTIKLYGDFAEPTGYWTEYELFGDKKSVSRVFTLQAAQTYEFKLKIDGVQYSKIDAMGAYELKSGWKTVGHFDLDDKGGLDVIKLLTDATGTYTFTYTYATDLLVVGFPSGGGTGVDNAEAGVKAVKTLENGMLIIEKNGVRYNAQGQVIK